MKAPMMQLAKLTYFLNQDHTNPSKNNICEKNSHHNKFLTVIYLHTNISELSGIVIPTLYQEFKNHISFPKQSRQAQQTKEGITI